MKIVTYNVNGIRASVKLGLKEWLASFDADVYCIQEVRANEGVVKSLLLDEVQQIDLFSQSQTKRLLEDYHAVFNCGKVAGYAGTMTLSKFQPDKVLYDMGEFWTDDEGRTTTIIKGRLAIVNAYIPNGNSRLDFKMKYLAALTKFITFLKQTYSVICVGDYNIAHNEIDLTHPKECKNKSVFLPIERKAFGEILDIGMIDSFRVLNPAERTYSWRSYRSRYDKSYNSWQYRIDYILVSDNLKLRLQKCEILDLEYSDHLPVVLEVSI